MNTSPLRQVTPTTMDNEERVCLVKLDVQYGQRIVRPVNEIAQTFAEMVGSKTLTQGTIAHIKKLGYVVKVVQDLPQEL